MSKCVTICPIGFVEEDILDRISGSIQERCGIECKILRGTENPQYAYDERRCQYNSRLILDRLLRCGHDTFGILGVIQVDLFVPIFKYVYGLALIGCQCAVISLHRLRPQFYDQPPNRDLLVVRAQKTALHEIGHSLGLTHCRDRRCVMYSSTRIADTDFKQSHYCPTCLELFTWHLERCQALPYP